MFQLITNPDEYLAEDEELTTRVINDQLAVEEDRHSRWAWNYPERPAELKVQTYMEYTAYQKVLKNVNIVHIYFGYFATDGLKLSHNIYLCIRIAFMMWGST